MLSADAPSVVHGLRLASLWAAWLFVMLFHVELGLMPLFHGLSVQIESKLSTTRLPAVFLAMLLYFLLPVLAMLLAVHAATATATATATGAASATASASWMASPLLRAGQFWFSLIYSLSNLAHLIADVRIPDSRLDQVLLMLLLTLLGLAINLEAWRWWQA